MALFIIDGGHSIIHFVSYLVILLSIIKVEFSNIENFQSSATTMCSIERDPKYDTGHDAPGSTSHQPPQTDRLSTAAETFNHSIQEESCLEILSKPEVVSQKVEGVNFIGWEGENDEENPRNWPKHQKWTALILSE
jgi:hypothetical protein